MLGTSRSAWLLAMLSAIWQVIIFPLENLYILGWIAIAPLLVGIFQARRPGSLQLQGVEKFVPANAKQGFLLGYACGVLSYAGACYCAFNTMKPSPGDRR